MRAARMGSGNSAREDVGRAGVGGEAPSVVGPPCVHSEWPPRPSWSRPGCRGVPPAPDLTECTVGWDLEMDRESWFAQRGHCSWGLYEIRGRRELSLQEQMARTDLPQMLCGVPCLENKEELTEGLGHPLPATGRWKAPPPVLPPGERSPQLPLLSLPPPWLSSACPVDSLAHMSLDPSLFPSSQAWHHLAPLRTLCVHWPPEGPI